MKKLISFVLCLCMIFTLAVVSFAANETVMVVSYDSFKGSFVEEYSVFHEGWTAAIQKSMDGNYKNVTVTLKKDWLSEDGQFTPDFRNKDGFDYDAINFPGGSHITLDLNGFKIDRQLESWEYNGEVMSIDESANVIIKNGTITGGFSGNGAGGIHIYGGNVTLENVKVTGNKVDDDDGAGIALLSGTLVMKGGSISDNEGTVTGANVLGGGLVVYGGEATLNDVTISGNYIHGGTRAKNCGAGVCVVEGTANLNNCTIENNKTSSAGGAIYVMTEKGKINLDKCVITGNTAGWDGNAIYLENGLCKVTNSNIFSNTNADGDPSVYLMYGEIELDNCYLDDEIYNVDGNFTWGKQLVEPLTLPGSLIANDSTIAIVFGAIAVVAAVVAFAFAKKKNRTDEEK